jgi:hypothetical protein
MPRKEWISDTQTSGLVVLDDAVWVASKNQVVRIDPKAMEIVANIPRHGHGPPPRLITRSDVAAIAAAHGAVWVPEFSDNKVLRIDPSTSQVTATVSIENPVQVLTGDDEVWVVQEWCPRVLQGCWPRYSLSQIDPETNRVVRTLPMGPAGWRLRKDLSEFSTPIAVGKGSVWAINLESNDILRISPQTGLVVATIRNEFVLFGMSGYVIQTIIIGRDAIWAHARNFSLLGLEGEHVLLRIDPRTNEVVATIRLQMYPFSSTDVAEAHARWTRETLLVADRNLLWVVTRLSSIAVDQTTNSVVATIPTAVNELQSSKLSGAGISHGLMWLAGKQFLIPFGKGGCDKLFEPACPGLIQAYELPTPESSQASGQEMGVPGAGGTR